MPAATSAQLSPGVGKTPVVNPAGLISLEPQDRSEALRRLAAVAGFFHRTEPDSPVSYQVQRAFRWGQMPFDEWLSGLIGDQGVLAHIRETLGIKLRNRAAGKLHLLRRPGYAEGEHAAQVRAGVPAADAPYLRRRD
jgi:hypothetical protein